MLLEELVKQHGVHSLVANGVDLAVSHRFNGLLKDEELESSSYRADQQKHIDALTAGLQKVSTQLEVGRTASHTVINNR